MVRIGIVGGTGYTGSELLRLLAKHPEVEMSFPAGPTSEELARALEIMFSYKKAKALGIASYPAGRDPNGMFREAAYNLVEGAIRGIRQR